MFAAPMVPLLAQLQCSIEMVAAPDDTRREGDAATGPRAVEHVIDFQDALTGEPLSAADVATLSPAALVGDSPVAPSEAERSPDGAALRRAWTFASTGSYTLRVDGAESRRYFGCERAFPVAGAAARRVRVSLVPRVRDVALRVEVRRGSSARQLPEEGLRAVELRPAAASEREVEVHAGRCSGERPATGSYWCVRSLSEAPRPFALTASTPGYGLAELTLDPASTERTVALVAGYQGHLMPATTVRVGTAFAALNGDGVGALASVDVAPSADLHGRTCPLEAVCVRPLVHAGFGALPYARDTLLLGPGTASTSDGLVRGTLWVFEVGGGVTVVPPGTGDTLRVTALASAALGSRGDERAARGDLLLSPATSRLGITSDLAVAWRFAGPVQLFAGARLHWFPEFGGAGRQFTFLGDAVLSSQTASLMQFVLQAGVGIEP